MKFRAGNDLGFYTVGTQRFESKIESCVAATKQNLHPEWNFRNEVWQGLDWTVEPELDILELYKARARQIREKYDYLIVYYSGGSDSQTMVEAFFDAGCHIDEIATVWNRKHASYVSHNPGDTTAKNIEAEFDLTTRQGLDWIRNTSPTTKISYYDISDSTVDVFKNTDGEEWLNLTAEHVNPQIITRWTTTREKCQLLTLDRGFRVGIIFGVDKPKICIKDGKYCAYFVDSVPNSFRGAWDRDEYDNSELVFFYWTADFPEIIVKQSHMIMRWFEANPMLKPILTWPNSDFIKRQTYEVILRGIVYPRWDLNTFQCNKTSSMVHSEWDHWFFHHYRNTNVYTNWHKGIEYIEKNVDRRFLNYTFDGQFNGFVGMINGHFCLQK